MSKPIDLLAYRELSIAAESLRIAQDAIEKAQRYHGVQLPTNAGIYLVRVKRMILEEIEMVVEELDV